MLDMHSSHDWKKRFERYKGWVAANLSVSVENLLGVGGMLGIQGVVLMTLVWGK